MWSSSICAWQLSDWPKFHVSRPDFIEGGRFDGLSLEHVIIALVPQLGALAPRYILRICTSTNVIDLLYLSIALYDENRSNDGILRWEAYSIAKLLLRQVALSPIPP